MWHIVSSSKVIKPRGKTVYYEHIQCDECSDTKDVRRDGYNMNLRCNECAIKMKTTTLYKKSKTIRFTDSEGDDVDMLVDYYKPVMTYTEIGKELGVSSTTAKTIYNKAIAKLFYMIKLDELAEPNDDKDIRGGAEKHYSEMAM